MLLHNQESSSLDPFISELDRLVNHKTNKHLTTLQRSIIRGVLGAATYQEIAEQSRWSEAHVKSVGADLWTLISDVLGEPVNKKNFGVLVERLYPHLFHERVAGHRQGTDLEFPDGPVALTSPFYCDRPPIESRCYEAITQPGTLIRIRAPRQMGKTSLLNRVLRQTQELGYVAVLLNLQLVDSDILQDLDRFLQWFCARVSHKLKLPLQLSDYWDDIFGSKTSCQDYFESHLLPQCAQPLVLALDDIDNLFPYPKTADGFFALLRAWYEEGKNNTLWENLRIILVHSTDAYVSLNIYQSPFNVGLPIDLPEFNVQQVTFLASQHRLNWTQTEVAQLMETVGGHPYLVRIALHCLTQSHATLESLPQMMLSPKSPFYGHLQEQLTLLERQPSLVTVLKEVLGDRSTLPKKPAELFQLTRMGLVSTKAGQIKIRCELYRQWLAACL